MQRFSVGSVVLILVCSFAALCLPPSVAHAYWTDIHGSSCEVEAPANATVNHRGYSLQVDQKPSRANLIHCQIPTGADGMRRVQFVRLQWFKSSANSKFVRFDIYDGRHLIKSVAAPAMATVGAVTETLVNLGAPFTITRGLGVSVFIQNLSTTTSTRFQVSDVGAYFY